MSINVNDNGTGPDISSDKPSLGFQGFTSDGEIEGAENFDFDPNSGSDEEDALEAAPESEPEEEESFEEEDAPKSKRFEKRVRQLNTRAKEAERENAELKALVEQLRKSNELQTRMQERQDQFWNQQEQTNKMQQRHQLMRQYGLDPTDTRDAIAFEQMEYKAQLERDLEDLKRQMKEQTEALQIERFNQALDYGLSEKLKGFKVDSEVRDHIRETAYDIAYIKKLTAAEAVEYAFNRYKKVLPKEVNQVSKPDIAAKAITMGNRSKGKAPGQKSGDGDDFLAMLDSGNFRL